MRVEGARRTWLALGILTCTGLLAWATMDAGKIREVVLVLLVGFAVRILLASRR